MASDPRSTVGSTTATLAMPPLYVNADGASLIGQRRYVRATGARLWLAVAAAVAVSVSDRWAPGGVEVFAAIAAVAFVGALVAEVWLLADRPENRWYDGRALAESTKTLAWRFAVGGAPFPIGLDRAAEAFGGELAQLLDDIADVTVLAGAGEPVTDEMIALRSESFAARKQAYLTGRIADQQGWYAAKARHNAKRAEAWKLALVLIEIAGVAAALAKAFGVMKTDLTSIASAAVAAGAAWLAVKQHESVARAYTFAAVELGLAAQRVRAVETEEQWAAEVANAEEAISREHTMWRAARSALNP